jgi:late competence protein required for DNA uptake (superfamily II DNA/RNA helicase)
MTRQKYDEYDMIERNYKIKCKSCGEKTYITWNYYCCSHCGKHHCPNCLTLPESNVSENSTPEYIIFRWDTKNATMGKARLIKCKVCGYEIVDTGVSIGY